MGDETSTLTLYCCDNKFVMEEDDFIRCPSCGKRLKFIKDLITGRLSVIAECPVDSYLDENILSQFKSLNINTYHIFPIKEM